MSIFADFDFKDFWKNEQNSSLTGSPLTDEVIAHAEQQLNCALPKSYLALLKTQNGGYIHTHYFYPEVNIYWGGDNCLPVSQIYGLGNQKHNIVNFQTYWQNTCANTPRADNKLVFFSCCSGNTDVLAFNYEKLTDGEPAIVLMQFSEYECQFVNEYFLAKNFETFIKGLQKADD